ncbi:hypothetical protein MA5S0422_2172 [Mycobacteroides abscessus 5S-0422]|uniref:Uncharacterized protein n=2 Tax=Mycobacteroides abscessus subsp. bolletii TaxID=319705 RepID=X8DSZ8_9MYCO|nr:hypothetical protein MASS_2360 [Mycobacteroides abscessus subsp. bolletii 50594]EIU14293.1 hypothetical protein MA5S0421_1568 [Mycobacteroides abscessus 5S-0421]EIU14626.1 hypothetical protein MA5S0304_1286 [Mycobacteroides abscessus 5S-0304]EIU15173.1 hypothetical protein MA5S0422_2172 [Mycobacteroides abscessus 5S-0422]EIU27021.1 hypothetical protein MA5S0708_1793 [Mycobacteroides abscessus 5S-0708]EIU27169.1 hypothetical protein MA5S0817_1348 [Mycobacteroides abscessus 5S-0817]EIU35474.
MVEGAEVLGGIRLSHSVPSCHDNINTGTISRQWRFGTSPGEIHRA